MEFAPRVAPNAEEDLLTSRPSAVAISLAALAMTVGVAATGSSSTVRDGQIAWKSFTYQGSKTWSIYAANPDASHIRRLTNPRPGVEDDLPDWSPDGSNVLFLRIFQPEGNPPTVPDEIMRVQADGSGLRQIGSCQRPCVANGDPQYSPDARRIVFTRATIVNGNTGLVVGVWIMDATGKHAHQITQLTIPTRSEDHEPAWSPDGKHIVFTRLNDTAPPANKQALFILASSGGKPHRLTPWALDAGGANWSPSGSTILFQSYRDCTCSGSSQVYEVGSNGSHLKQLTNSGWNIEPNWSPDGTKIIYAHEPGIGADGLPDLWTMDAHGEDGAPLVKTTIWDSEPDWGTARPLF
jgi:Tol biopolymer transport system component